MFQDCKPFYHSGDNFYNTTIYWSPIVPTAGLNTGFVNGSTFTLTPSTPITPFTAASPVTVALLSAKLIQKEMGQNTFTLSLADQTTYMSGGLEYKSELRMAGKWLKLFGLYPATNSVDTADMYISCTTAAATPSLTL